LTSDPTVPAWQIEVELREGVADAVGKRVEDEMRRRGLRTAPAVRTRRAFLVSGKVSADDARKLADRLFADPVVETATVRPFGGFDGAEPGTVAVFRKSGVMDPVEASALRACLRLGVAATAVRTGVVYKMTPPPDGKTLKKLGETLLSNAAVEDFRVEDVSLPLPKEPKPHATPRREVPIRDVDDAALQKISKDGGLALNLAEMKAIQARFREEGREPTDVELETFAQTWSEHCKHKTLTGPIRFEGKTIDNLLKTTIKAATETIAHPFCLSVFHDNAGVVRFDDRYGLAIKVETHNHPSAIEPFGGAGTGLGGVIRDILGTGRGAKPVANLDVFCVGPPDMPEERVPKGALHPLRTLRGVVAGVRDYGNPMGIPTVAGAVVFDERYAGNPLVYCGTVGLIPVDKVSKSVKPGDLVVAIGGRTGRDGVHGATFSSLELHEDSETVDAGAVQIGNPITEKKVADVVLAARDRDLFRAITDCGAGGFSSAVGEMAEGVGARVDLARAPLKYEGLTPAETWISEAQERMVLAVPPEHEAALAALCRDEDVEMAVLGTFTGTGRLEIVHGDTLHADLDLEFLHGGLPRVPLEATYEPPPVDETPPAAREDFGRDLLSALSDPGIASKEWIVRQYDHEVLGGSVVKPLVGAREHGPSDAAVVAPVVGSTRGFALGVGLNPRYGDLDPYAMAEAAIDEAVRNVVAVGGDPSQTAILDNFSWGNTSKPDRLGAMVRCCFGCRDAAIALGTPFVSGKDSLNNEYQWGDRTIRIPHTLLVTALAITPDVRRAVTSDFKRADGRVFLVGGTKAELGGSWRTKIEGRLGSRPPRLDGPRAKRLFAALHAAIGAGLVRTCHDLSEGGLLVAAAECAIGGDLGVEIDLSRVPCDEDGLGDAERAWSESLTRFLVETTAEDAPRFLAAMKGLPCAEIGVVRAEPSMIVRGVDGRVRVRATVAELERAWRPSLSRSLEGAS
jgi:phosphoribosylformylglycinamidine synthase subunit PurSL